MALPTKDQRHQYLRFEGLEYTDADITDFKDRLGKIYCKRIHQVLVLDFESLPVVMAKGLTSPLIFELIMEFFSTFRFSEVIVDIDAEGMLYFQLGGAKRRMSLRQFILALGLHTAEEMETAGFGLYWTESARKIFDKGDLSAYWLIACNIARRSQAPEKVTVTDLFYLRGMDVGSVNIPYLLARYLRMFASGRKRGAMISRGQFIARLAKHFGLLTKQRLQGLTPDATTGTLEVTEGAPDVDEGAQAVPAPVQAPQPPPATAQGEQREVLDSMARDFSRFTTWTVTSLSRMMDHAGVFLYGDLAGKEINKVGEVSIIWNPMCVVGKAQTGLSRDLRD
ncbi:hypothetical protein Tco_0853958 [Tanacetum coccineum]